MKKIYNRNWLFKLKSIAVFGSMLFAGAASAQLSGTYTINSANVSDMSVAKNFQSPQDFADSANMYGIGGPVTINVVASSGPYTGQVTLNASASGTSTNTVTINGNGNTFSHNSQSVFNLNGVDYYTFDNLVVDAQGTGTGTRCFWLHNDADNNTVSNSDLTLSAYTSTSNSTAYIAFSGSATSRSNSGNHGSNNVFDNNNMHGNGTGSGPYSGYSDYRNGTNKGLDAGNTLSNNTITDCYYGHTYLYYTGGCDINNNTFGARRSSAAATYYSNYLYYCGQTANSVKFNDNTITGVSPTGTLYATYIYYCDGTAAARMEVKRNKLLNNAPGGNFYGLRLYYNSNYDVEGNEVGNNTGNGVYNMYLYNWNENNILVQDNYIHDNVSQNTHYTIYNYANNGSNITTNRNRIIGNSSGSYLYHYIAYYGSNVNVTNNLIVKNSAVYYCYNFCYYINTGNYAHNTIEQAEAIDYYNYGLYGFFNANTTDFNIVNNIVVVGGTSAFGYNHYGVYFGGTLTGINFENNVYYHSGANATYQNGSNYGTAAAYVASSAETGSVNADPVFNNRATNDYTPTNPVISNIGLPGIVADDITMTTRTACGPDPGAYEFFVDHSATAISTLPATECGGYEHEVMVRFQNGTALAMNDVEMFYQVDGGTPVVEMIPTAAASTSTDLTFATKAVFVGGGTHTLTMGLGCDDNGANNTVTQTVVITPSPYGGDFSMGTMFDGYYNGGTMADPHATVNGYQSDLDISNVADAGATVTGSLMVTDETMTDVTADGFAWVPSGTNGAGMITMDPATTLSGKLLNVSLMVSEAATGCDTVLTTWAYVPHTPVADFTASNICLGDVAQFKNQSTLAMSNYSPNYIGTNWEFNDPDGSVTDDNSDIKDGFWEYTMASTSVDVEMTVVNALYPKFEYSVTKNIVVTPKPEVDFKVLNACEGNDITVINNTTAPSAVTYMWDFGGEWSSTAVTPSYTFATPGQRQISVIAESNGCTAELTKNAYQFETPVASFTSVGQCNFVDVEFSSTSVIPNNGNMGYKWDFAGEGISRAEKPAFAFATAGTKTVTLTATSEFGCKNSTTNTITLNESPEADFSWDAACNLTPINFTMTGSTPGDGSNSTFNWDFNGESATIQKDPTYQFPKVGSKQVTLTIDDLNGCSNTITKEVNVVLQAVADFDFASVCQGNETQFTGKSTVAAGNLTYKWTFGDSNESSDHSPTHTYTEAKSYNVTLEAIVAGGCSDVISKSVFVNPAADATFTNNKDGRTVVLDATDDANDQYIWRFGNGDKSTDANPTYTYENVDQGTYTICLASRKGDCWSEECEEVTIDLAGIKDLTENNDMINVYPNPSTGKFNVTVENAGDVVVKVGDILGNVITANVIDNLNGTYSVDMSAVADGVYFVQVKNGDYFATKRITVSK